MQHELDASLNSLLVAFTNGIKNLSYDLVQLLSSNCHDSLNESMVDFLLAYIYLTGMSEDRLLFCLHYNGIHHLLEVLYVRIHLLLLLLLLELCVRFCEHSLLFLGTFFSSPLLFLSHLGSVFLYVDSGALTAPSLPLLSPEVHRPLVASLASYLDHGLPDHISGPCVDLNSHTSALLPLYLALDGAHYLDTVVAQSVLLVSKAPEGDLASMAIWLTHLGLVATGRCLFFTSLCNGLSLRFREIEVELSLGEVYLVG